MTDPEVILWSRLRGRGDERLTFRRQHPFGSIILGFYCPSLRLAIEVDGATHWSDDAQLKDFSRDHWLAGQGVEMLRLPASQIYRDMDGVMEAIWAKLDQLKRRHDHERPLAPSTTRSSAGGPPPAATRGR